MKKRLLLGCGIIQKELEDAVQKYGIEDLDIRWMETGLHSEPKELNKALQKIIDETFDYDEIILGYGLCGNALLGITATNCDILYPKTDDCISSFMCELCNANELRRDSYFLSRGWLTMRSQDSLDDVRKKMFEKYDEETAEEILQMMYGNYKRIVYLQIEDEIDPQDLKKAKERAARMNFEFEIHPGSLRLYTNLILGDESDPGVKRLKKGEFLTVRDFMD